MRNADVPPTPRQPGTLDYVIATAAATTAALLVHGLSAFLPRTDQPAPISVSIFFCAVLLSAWRGIGPACLSVLLSLLAQYDFFRTHSAISQLAVRDEIRLACFTVVGFGITALGAAKNTALNAAWSANSELGRTLFELKLTNQRLEADSVEREQVYAKLAFSEALMTEGQRISHTGSWLFNIEADTLLWSAEHYRIFGYEPDIGRPTFDMATRRFHVEDRDRISRVIREAVASGARFECEYRIVLPGGVLRHILATGYQSRADGAVSGEYIGISVDITERREAEELLRKREREFRTLAENSPDCVIRYDLGCRRIYVNPAYERARGVSAGATLDQPLAIGWHLDMPVEKYERRLRRIIKTGEPDQIVGVWHPPGGKPIYCATLAVAERDFNGVVVSVLAITRDVSSIKQAQLHLEQSQRLLRQLASRSETVREEERKHLARELHDDLAQYLMALRIKISTLDFEFGARQPSLAMKTAGMISLVDSSIAVVRNIVTSLRPAALDMGIISALEWLTEEFIAKTGIPCRLQSFVNATQLSEAHAVAFFRIAQEALRNIARHAGATDVEISFGQEAIGYFLKIRDNGSGFDLINKKTGSFGLIGIRERALMLGGTVDLCTSPGQGTLIQVFIPTNMVSPNE